jgi:hypothetical protein
MTKEKRKTFLNTSSLLLFSLLFLLTVQIQININDPTGNILRSAKNSNHDVINQYHGRRLLLANDTNINNGVNILMSLNNQDQYLSNTNNNDMTNSINTLTFIWGDEEDPTGVLNDSNVAIQQTTVNN